MSKVCPQCERAFADMDYCPEHGLALVFRVAKPDSPASVAATPGDSVGVAGPAPTGTGNDPTPDTVSAAPINDGDAVKDRFARFLQASGVRLADHAAQTATNPATPAEPVAGNTETLLLPENLRRDGWRATDKPRSLGGLTRWPVARTTARGQHEKAWFHRFGAGALTPEALYRRLEAQSVPHLCALLAHGTMDVAGTRNDFELVAHVQPGSMELTRWLQGTTPSETRALQMLPAVVSLLESLAEGGVRPLLLEPELLVRGSDGALTLTTSAALHAVDDASAAHPEFARSTLLPRGWTAPEIADEQESSANAAVFSLGQLLAMCLWGQPCSLAAVHSGQVSFNSIADARLARIMMGCLWPKPAERWTLRMVADALAQTDVTRLPEAPAWSALARGAGSTAFSLAGKQYWRLDELLQAAIQPDHWQEATTRIEALLAWMETTTWVGQVPMFRDALANGRSADWVLVRLRRTIDPQSPLSWRNLALDDEHAEASLIALAQRALRDGGRSDAALLQALFECDLREAFTPEEGKPDSLH